MHCSFLIPFSYRDVYNLTRSRSIAIYTNRKKIANPRDLLEMIKTYLECQIGPADCTALGNSYSCSERKDLNGLREIDRTIFP